MEETMIMTEEETMETEVVEDTELATYDENVESDTTASKVAVGAGLATILVGGFLITKKLVKKHKAKKATQQLGKEAEELGTMIEKYATMQKETLELKKKIDSMMPQSCDNMEIEIDEAEF